MNESHSKFNGILIKEGTMKNKKQNGALVFDYIDNFIDHHTSLKIFVVHPTNVRLSVISYKHSMWVSYSFRTRYRLNNR